MSDKDKDVVVIPGFTSRQLKKLPEGTRDMIDSLNTDEIKKKLIECARSISETERDMENDVVLNDLEEDLKEKRAPYREAINASRLMMKYLVYVLDSRGDT